MLKRYSGVLIVLGLLIMGIGAGELIGSNPQAAQTSTRTVRSTTRIHSYRLVTVRVSGRVLERRGPVVTVLVPRTVIHTRSRTFVVRRHVVRIRARKVHGLIPVTGALVGAAPPPPVTVTIRETVPVTVTATETVSEPPVTVTLPAETSTETVTVSVPALSGGSS